MTEPSRTFGSKRARCSCCQVRPLDLEDSVPLAEEPTANPFFSPSPQHQATPRTTLADSPTPLVLSSSVSARPRLSVLFIFSFVEGCAPRFTPD